MAVAAVCASA